MSQSNIKTMVMNAPTSNTDPELFVKFVLIPQYKGMQKTWPRHDIFININLYEDTVGSEYFEKVNAILKRLCPEIISKYVLVRKDDMKG